MISLRITAALAAEWGSLDRAGDAELTGSPNPYARIPYSPGRKAILFTPTEVEELRSQCDYYLDPDGFCPSNLKRSARLLLDQIECSEEEKA